MEEQGLVWQGGVEGGIVNRWGYDQFEWAHLQIAMNLLWRVPYAHRADPELVRCVCERAARSPVCGVVAAAGGRYA